MPEGKPPMKAGSKAAAVLLLVLQVVGTLAFVTYGTWKLWEEERGDGLLYLSVGILWFMLFSWRLRWVLNPKPQ